MKFLKCLVIACAMGAAGGVAAQDYPSKSIRLLIPAAPGGGVDSIARLLATKLSTSLGKPVVPENRAGAGTLLASEMLAASPPDGYTALMVTSSHTVNAALRKTLRFDPIGDFSAVSLAGSSPDLLVVNASSPYRTVADLVAAAKKDPGKVTFGSSGPGSLSHLEGEMLKAAAGADLLHIPYRGGVPAVTALMGNEIHSLFLGVVALAPQIKAGKLRPIAVTSRERSPMFPQVPTMIESGFQGYETGIWYGVLLPAKTPPAVVATLHKHVNDALKQPEVREKLIGAGIEPLGSTPAQFTQLMKDDVARWQKVVEKAPHLKLDE